MEQVRAWLQAAAATTVVLAALATAVFSGISFIAERQAARAVAPVA